MVVLQTQLQAIAQHIVVLKHSEDHLLLQWQKVSRQINEEKTSCRSCKNDEIQSTIKTSLRQCKKYYVRQLDTKKRNIELKSSQLFNLHLHGAISHEVPLPGHSNYVGSEISVRSHYLYRWNDRGQQYQFRNATTAYTSIYPFQQHIPDAISHEVPLPEHSNYAWSEISVRSHYLYRCPLYVFKLPASALTLQRPLKLHAAP